MPEPTIIPNTVFKFVVVRPPQLQYDRGTSPVNRTAGKSNATSVLQTALVVAKSSSDDAETQLAAMRTIAADFLKSTDALTNEADIDAWDDSAASLALLWDNYVAQSIVRENPNLQMRLAEVLQKRESVEILTLPDTIFPLPRPSRGEFKPDFSDQNKKAENAKKVASLQTELEMYQMALEELSDWHEADLEYFQTNYESIDTQNCTNPCETQEKIKVQKELQAQVGIVSNFSEFSKETQDVFTKLKLKVWCA